jgi:hypothetical protein
MGFVLFGIEFVIRNSNITQIMMRFLILLPLLVVFSAVAAQNPYDLAIPVSVNITQNPPSVTLSWPSPIPANLVVRRRIKGAAGTLWTNLVNQPNSGMTQYVDSDLSATQSYEYEVVRTTGVVSSGSAYATFLTDPIDYRGKIIVVIDSTTAQSLGSDFNVYINDLRGEGWQVTTVRIGPFATIQSVKNQIVSLYNADQQNTKAVLLVGNVPVPYSGTTAWDNKNDHIGAWPTDAFYGDVNGTWSDFSANVPNAPRPANRNVPFDGKFDQNTIPSETELAVGRVDFRRLTSGVFGANPTELTRRYFQKNHRWRIGQYRVPQTALVDDEWGNNGDAPSADGWRNAFPLVGVNGVNIGEFSAPAPRKLFSYGAGASGGSYTTAPGVMTSTNFATDSVNAVFAGFFGDYIGDWDFDNNPFMPASIASRGGLLAAGWMGRPRWQLQGLAVGEPIGYCLRETQNAQFNDAYGNTQNEGSICINLMGDPTVRAQIVAPPTNITVQSNCTEMRIRWTAPNESNLAGYLIYRSNSRTGRFTRISTSIVNATEWSDPSPLNDSAFYQVRAIKIFSTPGAGSFFVNSSSATVGGLFVQGAPPSVIATGGSINCSIPNVVLGANFQPFNATYQWYKPNGMPLNGAVATSGGTYTVIVTSPTGCTASATALVQQDTFLPVANFPTQVVLSCANPVFLFTVPPADPNVLYYYNDVIVQPGGTFSITGTSVFRVYSFVNGCTDVYVAQVAQDFLPPVVTTTAVGSISCATPSIELQGTSSIANATYAWSGPQVQSTQQNITVSNPGTYCLTVTGTNGCSSTSCAQVTSTNGVLPITIQSNTGNCNLGLPIQLTAVAQGGLEPYTFEWQNGGNIATYDVPSGFTGTISVLVRDQSGCQGTGTYTVPGPYLATISANPSPCDLNAGPITLTAQATGGAGNNQYAWSNGASTQQITLPNGFTGTMTVSITDQNNCTTTDPIILGSSFFAAVFFVLPSSPTATNGSIETTLFSGNAADLTYAWSNGATTSAINNLGSGTYTVTISDSNGCSQILTVPLIVSDADEAYPTLPEVAIWPNPAQDIVYVEIENNTKSIEIQVIDLLGRVVLRQQNNNQTIQALDVSHLAAGGYFVQLSMTDAIGKVYVDTKRIVVRR